MYLYSPVLILGIIISREEMLRERKCLGEASAQQAHQAGEPRDPGHSWLYTCPSGGRDTHTCIGQSGQREGGGRGGTRSMRKEGEGGGAMSLWREGEGGGARRQGKAGEGDWGRKDGAGDIATPYKARRHAMSPVLAHARHSFIMTRSPPKTSCVS